jgi:hypothetical protein
MLQVSKLVKSRDNWKSETIQARTEVRRCHKAVKRYKVKINLLKLLLEVNGIEDTTRQLDEETNMVDVKKNTNTS